MWTPTSKYFASYNILLDQYLCDFIHVLIFATVSKRQKSPKLMNIVIVMINTIFNVVFEGHFTHEIESPWPLHFKHCHRWKRQSVVQVRPSHYAWGTNGVGECKMDIKVHGFLHGIKWIMVHGHLDFSFKNHLLEVGLTQNQEIMALQKLTTVDLFYSIMCEDPHE